MKTDHWFFGLFQSAPDLIALLLPQGAAEAQSLGPDAPGDALYRFEAPELKAANHRLDGAFWPRSGEAGTPEQPVVLLEVQMHSKPGFTNRLGAGRQRLQQRHPVAQPFGRIVALQRMGVDHRLPVAPLEGLLGHGWRAAFSFP